MKPKLGCIPFITSKNSFQKINKKSFKKKQLQNSW